MASAVTTNLVKQFVAQYGAGIVNAISNTGLFFPAVVAQLSVESANGTSGLATRANNFGGIQGNASNGILMDTTETNARTASKAYFKTYPDFNSFMQDYVNIFQGADYIQAGVLTATSPEDQITAMVNAGYSTMTPSAYLATGIQDRINATRDIYGIGTIGDTIVADASIGALPAGGANADLSAPYGIDLSQL